MSSNRYILPVIRSSYPELTKLEKRIADYINLNPEKIIGHTILDLAQETQSSEITISRFCKKLGFSGLQGLKLAIASEVLGGNDKPYQDIQPNDSYELITNKIFNSLKEGLSDTLKLLDYKAIGQAVNAIMKARRIEIYGFGNSATVCRDIETKFLRFGFSVHSYSDAHQQATSAVVLTKEDLVIAVSHTGSTLELIESVKLAKENKVKVIVITSHIHSPLSSLADISLHGMGREVRYSSEASSSRLIHLAITDVLYTAIAMKMPEKYRKNLKKMREAISYKRS